ncbi:MAG: hypothetical protein ABJA83_16035 [Burkholderiaceae bacterium]
MNSYDDYYGADAPKRRSRKQVSTMFGDAIGCMVAATVFGLTRAIEDFDSAGREGTATTVPDR